MKRIYISVLIFIFLVANISAIHGIWININEFTPELKKTSIQFKYLKGGNRMAEFNILKHLIETAIQNKNSANDIINILGYPDTIMNNKALIYSLQFNSYTTYLTVDINHNCICSYSVNNILNSSFK